VNLLTHGKKLFDKIFIRSGHLGGLNDPASTEFSDNKAGISSSDPACGTRETSKGDQLWSLFGLTDDVRVMRAMVSLWDHEQALIPRTPDTEDPSG